MREFIFNENQLRKLVEMTAQAVLENTEIDIEVYNHEVSIKTAESSLSFDDAVQIEGVVGVGGLAHILPIERNVDYRNF